MPLEEGKCWCCNSGYSSAFGNTMFLVFPPGAYTNKSEGLPTREQATYSCPCAKHGFSKFSPHTIYRYTKGFPTQEQNISVWNDDELENDH
jgi:hypothetical protein